MERAESFVYRPVNASDPTIEVVEGNDSAESKPATPEVLWKVSTSQQGPLMYTEEDICSREKQASERGIKEAEGRIRAEFEQTLAAMRTQLLDAAKDFTRERESYFHRAEAEVVRLTLSIARKILACEAQVDPLLLTGMVRVALEKIAASSSVKLRVPQDQVGKWMEMLARQEHLKPLPEVVGDPSLSGTQCLLETEVGTTDLSLETQLKEIEKGFLDLLALRPES